MAIVGFIFIGVVVQCLTTTDASLIKDPLTMSGNVRPSNIMSMVGQEVRVHLPIRDRPYRSCKIRSLNSTKDVDLFTARDYKIKYWGLGLSTGQCGTKIGPIDKSDEGRWRLTGVDADNNVVKGYAYIKILDLPSVQSTIDINTDAGQTVYINTIEQSDYCEVARPTYGTEPVIYPGNCKIMIDGVTAVDSGVWTTRVAPKGKIQEVVLRSNITVKVEKLKTGFTQEGNSYNIYCNLENSKKSITFCRFIRTSDDVGFSLRDGLSNSRYSYFGSGLHDKECGIRIESATNVDLTTWKCVIGFNGMHGIEMIESTISIYDRTQAEDSRKVRVPDITLSQRGKLLTVHCKVDVSLSYCWWSHPNGTIFAPTPGRYDQQSTHWFSGGNLLSGECGLTIKESNAKDAGSWACHLGRLNSPGTELVGVVKVLIGENSISSKARNYKAKVGATVTLRCSSIPMGVPIEYCRFLPPTGTGFSLTEDVKKQRPIENQYYYGGESLLKGDCSVTIASVQKNHFGVWTCGTRLTYDESYTESRDSFRLIEIPGKSTTAFASSTYGLLIGTVLVVVLVSYKYKKGHRQKTKSTDNGIEMTNRNNDCYVNDVPDTTAALLANNSNHCSRSKRVHPEGISL